MVDARRLVGAGRRGAGHGEVLPPVARAGLNDPPGVRRPNRLLAGKEAAGWERGCWLAPPPLLLSVRRGGSQSWGKKGCWLAASKLLGWAHYTPPPTGGWGALRLMKTLPAAREVVVQPRGERRRGGGLVGGQRGGGLHTHTGQETPMGGVLPRVMVGMRRPGGAVVLVDSEGAGKARDTLRKGVAGSGRRACLSSSSSCFRPLIFGYNGDAPGPRREDHLVPLQHRPLAAPGVF